MAENVDALLSAMRAEAETEREAILSEARAKAHDIAQRADTEIEKLKAEALQRLDIQMRQESDRVLGKARMYKRGKLLSAKRELIKEAFDRAGDELARLCKTSEYRNVVERLIREAVGALGSEVEIEVAAQDTDMCDELAAEMGINRAARAAGDGPGTVAATTVHGRRRVDNSLPTRLAKAESVAVQEVARLLFGGSGTAVERE